MADIVIEFESRNADKTISELQRLQSVMNSTADGTTALARTLNTSIKSAQAFAKSIGTTTDTAGKAAARIKELNRVNANSAQKYKVIQQELGLTRKQFLAVNQAVDQQAKALAQLQKQQQIASKGMQDLAIASGAVATAIGAVFAKGTQNFVEFSRALQQVGAISGSLGTEAFEGLSNEIERLGIVTSKAPAEIAQTAVSLARAGFEADQITNALEGVVRASEATGESLEVVGDIMAKTLRTFQIPARESQSVADALVATANSTNTTVSSIGESLAFVGAQAAAANQPLNDTLIAIGLLGDAGIQGSSAGTQLGQALERLKTASAGSTSELANLVRGNGKAVAAFEKLNLNVRDSDGQMRSLIDIVPDLRTQLDTLSQEEQDLVGKALFGIQGGRAIQSILQATPGRVAEVTEAIRESEGAARKASEELLQGLPGALSLLEGSLGSLTKEFGEFTAQFLEPLVRTTTDLINTFLALPSPIQKALIATTAFTGVLAGAVAVSAAFTALKVKERTELAIAAALQIKKNAIDAVSLGLTLARAKATGQLTTAQSALIASTTKAIATTGLLAAAVGSLVLAASRFQDAGAETSEAVGKLQQDIEELLGTASDLEDSLNITIEPAPTDFLDGLFTRFDDLENESGIAAQAMKKALDFSFVGAAQSLNKAANFLRTGEFEYVSNAEKQVNELAISVGELGSATGTVIDQALQLRQTYPDAANATADEIGEAIRTQKALSAALDVNVNQLQSLDREQLGSEAYESLSGQIRTNIALLENQQTAIREQTGVAEDGSIAIEAQADATQELVNATADLDAVLSAASQRNAEFGRSLAEGNALLNERLAAGLIDQGDYLEQSNKLEEQALKDRINSNKQAAQQLQGIIESGGLDPDALTDAQSQLLDIETETFDLRSELAEKTADARIEAEKKAEAVLEESLKASQDAIAASETQRLTEIQRSLNAGIISQEQADQQRLNSTEERIKAEIAAANSAIAQLRASGADDSEIRAELQKTADLQLQLLELEGQKQERLKNDAIAAAQEERDARIAAIEQQSEVAQAANDAQVLSLEKQSAAIQTQENAIARRNELLAAQSNLQNALSQLQEARTNAELGSLNEALSLTQRLETEEDARTKRLIRNRLRELGVRGDSEDIQVRISELEEQAARQKLDALLQQQESERASLQLQIQSNELAAQRAITEARIAEIRAQGDIAQAQADLASAQQIEDPNERNAAIAAANAQLEASQQVAELSALATSEAEQQLSNVERISQEQLKTLDAQQESARLTAEAAVSAAAFADALTRAERASGALSSNLGDIGGVEARREGGPMSAGQPYLVGDRPGGKVGPDSEIVVPGVSSYVLANRKVKQLLAAKYNPPTELSRGSGRVKGRNDALISEVQGLRRDIGKLDRGGVQIQNAKFPTQVTVAKTTDPEAILVQELQRLRRINLGNRRIDYGNR